jgi:hypothetical protein
MGSTAAARTEHYENEPSDKEEVGQYQMNSTLPVSSIHTIFPGGKEGKNERKPFLTYVVGPGSSIHSLLSLAN